MRLMRTSGVSPMMPRMSSETLFRVAICACLSPLIISAHVAQAAELVEQRGRWRRRHRRLMEAMLCNESGALLALLEEKSLEDRRQQAYPGALDICQIVPLVRVVIGSIELR